jgi:hypothetical protein
MQSDGFKNNYEYNKCRMVSIAPRDHETTASFGGCGGGAMVVVWRWWDGSVVVVVMWFAAAVVCGGDDGVCGGELLDLTGRTWANHTEHKIGNQGTDVQPLGATSRLGRVCGT